MKARGVFCPSCMVVHWSGEWPRECVEARQNTKRGSVASPYIRTDGMDPLLNHANGQMYDSRSAYERAVKDAGCVIVGNDIPDTKEPETLSQNDLKRDIKTAIEQVEAGYHGPQ